MKQFMLVRFLIIFVMMFMSSVTLIADDDNNSCTITLNPQLTDDPDDPEQLIAGSKRKTPGRPIVVTINEGVGVTISNCDEDEIILYSIFDSEGLMIFSSIDEVEFSSTIFTLHGYYEIKFEIGEKIFKGSIYL